ncbi:MAG: LysR family transcriptional regulator [Alphaproteobacteria bacterium]
MQFRQLAYFVAVAEHGSFSAASVALRIAQPSIGQQIKNLEEDLGTTLFHRHSRGIELTGSGRTLLSHARDILDRVDAARRTIRDESDAPVGRVRVGLTLSASLPLAVPLVTACNDAYPRIDLVLIEALSNDLVTRIADDRVDLALTYSGAYPDGVRGEALADEDYHFCVSADHPLADRSVVDLADVLDSRMCLPPETHMLRRQVGDAARANGKTADVAMEVESITTITMLVESGIYASILPYSAVAHTVSAGGIRAIPIANPPLQRRMSLIFTTRRHLTKAENAVRTLIIENTRRLIDTGTLKWRAPDRSRQFQ